MSYLLYRIRFKLRRYLNYILYTCFYRLKYPEMAQYRDTFRSQSYSAPSVLFLKIELKDFILSTSNLLNKNSIVIDVGGETGIWAMQVYSKYEPNLYIFEPNPKSLKVLHERFSDKKCKIFNFGLGSKNMIAELSNCGMGSSIFDSSPAYNDSDTFQINIRDVAEVFSELSLESVDLIKINIEGGEYDLVPGMIESGVVNKCKIIRIQFHDWMPDAFAMRKRIVKALAKTHNVEWSYPMVWESWIRKDISISTTSPHR